MPQESVLIGERYRIERQEGDDGSIEMTVPAYIDLDGVQVIFEVFHGLKDPLFSKTNTPSGGIVVSGQTIVIELLAADTEGFPGTHNSRVRIIRQAGKTTIGRGVLVIV